MSVNLKSLKKNSKGIYTELKNINELVFLPCGIELTNLKAEQESQEYFAHNFQLGGQKVIFRMAKITPTKSGQFVTIWKRNEKGVTVPFDISDDVKLYIIAARKNTALGLFIFPKSVLYNNRILSDKMIDGKRGIRVYPPWDLTTNKQAQKTQFWQTKYFLEISEDKQINLIKAKDLLQDLDLK